MVDTIQSLAQELADAIGEKDGSWRAVGIQRDIDAKSDNWQRWTSIVGWPHRLANKIDNFILLQRKGTNSPAPKLKLISNKEE